MKKDLLTIFDLTSGDIKAILKRAAALKKKQTQGKVHQSLKGKSLGMIFEKSSTRTRVSFEVGMYQLGGQALFLSSNDLQIGRGETVTDTARTLSRFLDAIMIRTFAQATVEELANHASIPVINGLTDLHHPCQALADLFTIQEKKRTLKGLKLAYVGDGNNVANSLIQACVKTGIHFSIATPRGYELDIAFVNEARTEAVKTGTVVEITDDPYRAVKSADIVYTDVWASMGQEAEHAKRLKAFQGYQIDAKLIGAAAKGALVMHCLPAHRGEEISAEVLDGPQSVVFDQAENRLHTQKAVLEMLMR
ncbi:MAG TPA: ornithine carbamoyltransferase [Nitrospirota bacterium]|nr:ornithine carbamoyltransferase [Nitrospirota bacterium]